MKRSLIVFGLLVVLAVFALAVSAPYGPVVVKKVVLANQTSSVTSQTLITPEEDGDYVVYGYITGGTQGPGGAGEASISWTDEIGSRSCGLGTASEGQQTSAICVVHVVAGDPINLSTIYSTSATDVNISFNVFITVVKE